jgi:predicted RNA binding protein YcfA (HicA-like mRNA interferase family)
MPRKKRDIRADYRKAGFNERQGKGDHVVYSHPLLKESYAVAGVDGKDALPYDEKNLRKAKHVLAQATKKLRQQQQKGKQP